MQRRQADKLHRGEGLPYVIVFVALAIMLAGGILYNGAHQKLNLQSKAIPPFYASTAQAQPLPSTLEPARFQSPKIQTAYAVAKAMPAVLAQQPCYCGCARRGHHSLLDCFKDQHAASCTTCIKEALYADQMNTKGQCTEAIREGIIQGDWKLLQ